MLPYRDVPNYTVLTWIRVLLFAPNFFQSVPLFSWKYWSCKKLIYISSTLNQTINVNQLKTSPTTTASFVAVDVTVILVRTAVLVSHIFYYFFLNKNNFFLLIIRKKIYFLFFLPSRFSDHFLPFHFSEAFVSSSSLPYLNHIGVHGSTLFFLIECPLRLSCLDILPRAFTNSANAQMPWYRRAGAEDHSVGAMWLVMTVGNIKGDKISFGRQWNLCRLARYFWMKMEAWWCKFAVLNPFFTF